MSKIVFRHPLTTNSLANFDPSDKSHYPKKGEKGIYIYGLRLKINGELKFIPIVVGEGDDLQRRLFKEHYKQKFDNPLSILLGIPSNVTVDRKEMWDFSKRNYQLNELVNIYNDLKNYDSIPSNSHRLNNVSKNLNHLIFYQDFDFFHIKYSSIPTGVGNKTVDHSIDYLTNMLTMGCTTKPNDVKQHIAKIISTLVNFRDNFYFIYATNDENNIEINFNSEEIRRYMEKQTKDNLTSINIHTTADTKSKIKTPPIQIDLTNVRKELINTGNHNYNDISGNYKNPLIL